MPPAGQVQQDHEPARSFHHRADRRAVARAEDEVAFPMPWHGPVGGLGRSLVEHRHVRQGAGTAGIRAAVRLAGIGDVLLRVQATSFTPDELDWPSTWVDRAGHDRRPAIPGHEVAGVVAELGMGTTGFSVGDAVYGLTDWYRDGAAAEYVAVEARNLARRPALDPVQAAAVPLAGLTAYQALFDHGRLATGQTVLVHGASGGVGTFAVQLARAAGARIVATGRAGAKDLVTE